MCGRESQRDGLTSDALWWSPSTKPPTVPYPLRAAFCVPAKEWRCSVGFLWPGYRVIGGRFGRLLLTLGGGDKGTSRDSIGFLHHKGVVIRGCTEPSTFAERKKRKREVGILLNHFFCRLVFFESWKWKIIRFSKGFSITPIQYSSPWGCEREDFL